jgi:hypothetical protein
MGGSKKTTVGYWYKALFHHGLGNGPIDALLEVRGGDRTAWKGAQTSSGTITINAPMLWGGEKDQGGIVGDMDVMLGEAAQQPNSYLLANLGPQIPAWRGIASVVFKGGKYGAMNPYPQPVSYKIRRIIAGWDGTCWNSSKAEIVMKDIREPVTGGSGWVNRATGLFYVGAYKAVSGFYSTFNGWFNGYIGGLRATAGVARYPLLSYAVPTVLFGDASTDPYWGNVICQLRMQGSNGSTAFIDDKGHTVAAFGGAVISTAQAPFGGSSGYFNGTNSYLTVNVGSAEALGGAWTIDGWVRLADYDSTSGTYGNTIFSYGAPGTPGYESTMSVFGNLLRFGQQESSPSNMSAEVNQNIGDYLPINQWAFVSICFDGARHWLHVNGQLVTSFSSLKGMNPAHMLYYSRTNSDMGGEDTANIDATSLSAAADTLFSEGFGLCTTRNPGSESVEEFEGRIAKVIGGAFGRDPVDGKWYLDLARGDYVLSSLPILTDDDVIEFSEAPATLDSAINSVSVKYFDPELRETITTPPVQARGLIAAFGTNHQTFDYPEIPTADLALRVAQRELRATATPLRAFELVTTRVTHSWRVNTYFRLQLPKRGIADMVCIVGQKQSGTLRSGAIRIGAVQDVYSMPAAVFVLPESGVDTSASENPMVISRQRAIELPYTEVVQILSRADLSVLPADVGFLATVADDPARSVDYTLMVDDGSGYAQRAVASWCPTATVVEAGTFGGTAYTLAGGVRLDQVEIGSAALWGDEIVRVVSLDVTTGAVVFGRGCADTVPQPHAAGERIWFITGDAAIDPTEYVSGETLAVKLLTNTGSQQLAIAVAAAMSVPFSCRQIRPYPPGKLLINGSAYPDKISGGWSATWAHRDRLTQADQLVDTTSASIGPEAGTTYTVRMYGEADTLLRTFSGLTGASIDWPAEEADSGLTIGGAPGGNPDWLSVVALLHFNGANNSTVFRDERGNSFTAAGTAKISTAQSKFGGSSGLFDGSTNCHVTATPSADYKFGTGDFTIDVWVYASPSVQAWGRLLENELYNSSTMGWHIAFNGADSAGSRRLGFQLSNPGGGGAVIWTNAAFPTNTWTHFSVERVGSTVYLYVNGAKQTATMNVSGKNFVSDKLRIGYVTSGTDGGYYIGNIDELQITKLARHNAANFTPETAEFAGGASRLNNLARAELESIRASYTSLQKHNVTTRRVGYGYSYGHSYGGL